MNKLSEVNPKKIKDPKNFQIYPIKKMEEFGKPPKKLIPPYDEIFNKNGGNILILGPPSSGKSIYANNLILSEECFKDCFDGACYAISPTINHDLSSCFLKSQMDFVEDEYSEELMRGIVENILSVKKKEMGFSLIFLDDCLDAFKSHKDYMNKVTAIIRHLKSVCIMSCQRLKGISSGIRSNLTISVIFYIPSHKEYKQVEEFHSFFGGEKVFKEAYDEATSIKYGCLVCDFRNLKMYKHGANTTSPELLWSKYNDDGTKAKEGLITEINKGEIKNLD